MPPCSHNESRCYTCAVGLRRSRTRARLVAVVGGTVAAVATIELALQGISLAVWLSLPRTSPVTDKVDASSDQHRDVILCVGDSNTFGVGATHRTNSYPSLLAEHLEADWPGRFRVVNAGIPGRNSRELLLKLPKQLEQHAPTVVCVLVGVNDLWTYPKRVAPEELDAGHFPIRWRTRRLVLLAIHALTPRPALASHTAPLHPVDRDTGLIGVWHNRAAGLELAFTGDGILRIGQTDSGWTQISERELRLTGPDGPPVRAQYLLLDGQLIFSGGGLPNLAFQHGPLTNGDAPSPDLEAIEHELSVLMEEWYNAENRDRVLALVERAVALESDPTKRGAYLRSVGMLPMPGRDKLIWLMRASLNDGLYQPVEVWIHAHTSTREEFLQTARAALDIEQRSDLSGFELAWRRAANRDGSKAPDILKDHLRRIVDRCHRAGARVLIMDYMRPIEAVSRGLDQFAGDPRVERVRLDHIFDKALETADRQDLFIPDGHCNDRGYVIMARAIFEKLAAML